MKMLRLLKKTFVICSCVFTAVFLLGLVVSWAASAVFQANWVRDAGREVGDRLLLWQSEETEATPRRHAASRGMPDTLSNPEPHGVTGYRLREWLIRDREHVSGPLTGSRQRDVPWREIRKPLLGLVNSLMRRVGEDWKSVNTDGEFSTRLPEILERLGELEKREEEDRRKTFLYMNELDIANLLGARREDGSPRLDDEDSLFLLSLLSSSRRADVLRYLSTFDPDRAADLLEQEILILRQASAAGGPRSGSFREGGD